MSVAVTLYFKGHFCDFQNRSVSISYVLNLFQNRESSSKSRFLNYIWNTLKIALETCGCWLTTHILSSKTKCCERLIIGNILQQQHCLMNSIKYYRSTKNAIIIRNMHMKRFQQITILRFLILMIFSFKSTNQSEIIYC